VKFLAAQFAAPAVPVAPAAPQRLVLAMMAVALWVFALALPAIGARASYGARVTADEPQYLITAISIAEDFDLDISDELAERRFEPFHEINLNPQTIPLDDSGRRISPHDPLLPALLALPMLLGGWVAAKTALAATAAATAAATLWLAVRRFGVSPGIGAVVTGAFFAAPPLVSYATQVYPEMPAALCVTLGLAAVTGPLRRVGQVSAVVSIVALPWLSVKFVPVAAVLAVVMVLRLWPRHRLQLLFNLALLAVAGVAYLIFHRIVYGGWTAYASGDHFVDGELLVFGSDPDYVGRSRRLIGLIVDRGFGLAAWTPAYLLAVPALFAWSRRRQHGRRAVLLCVFSVGYAMAVWAALTMHGWWWPGRQVVAVLPVVVIAAAMLVEQLRGLRLLLLTGCLLGTFNWLWLVVEASTGRRTLIVDFTETANPLYQVWSALLPDHRNYLGASQALTLVWVALIAAVTLLVWLRLKPQPAAAARYSSPGDDHGERFEAPTFVDATKPAQPDRSTGR